LRPFFPDVICYNLLRSFCPIGVYESKFLPKPLLARNDGPVLCIFPTPFTEALEWLSDIFFRNSFRFLLQRSFPPLFPFSLTTWSEPACCFPPHRMFFQLGGSDDLLFVPPPPELRRPLAAILFLFQPQDTKWFFPMTAPAVQDYRMLHGKICPFFLSRFDIFRFALAFSHPPRSADPASQPTSKCDDPTISIAPDVPHAPV